MAPRLPDKPRTHTIEGYSYLERQAKGGQTSARVFVPLSWKDKKVAVVLLDPLDE